MILGAFYGFSTATMKVSIDFGGSTIDIVRWKGATPFMVRSFERFPNLATKSLSDILRVMKFQWHGVEKIFVTGGKSSFFPKKINDVPIIGVSEIDAIGQGGNFLLQKSNFSSTFKKAKNFLVVSMGTGTCMVRVRKKKNGNPECKHVGGTGVGGGTFIGLSKALLQETRPQKLMEMFQRGNRNKVDLSVKDIVGRGIGFIPGHATASNLAKLAREINFSKADVAAGILNLIGQTIGTTSTFAARSEKSDFILLTGKLTRIEQLIDIVKNVSTFYKMPMLIPKDADYVSAFGAAQ